MAIKSPLQEVVLSIMIPTTRERRSLLSGLLKTLHRQIKDKPVEIVINDHEKDNVGKKRNEMLQRSKGLWVISADSDDMVSNDYVDKILKALESDPDCVGISGFMTTNGKNPRNWHISKEYGGWREENGVYLRTPNHISPVRRSIAIQVGYPEIKQGEDYAYSMGILPLLKTEVKIEGHIYHYRYRTINK